MLYVAQCLGRISATPDQLHLDNWEMRIAIMQEK